VVIACAIYLPNVYDETWGGWQDVFTALAVGLAGNAVISWVALPLFQSRRLRGVAEKS
jgi:hypothetical protein